MARKITENFTLEEFTLSQTAVRKRIDNSPDAEVLKNIRRVALVLEEVRVLVGAVPILISSGYRCQALNDEVNGAVDSYHLYGLAVDFVAPRFGSPLKVARAIANSGIEFDQVIHEFGSWVHLALPKAGNIARGQRLSIFAGTGYLNGLVGQPST